jgi:hypothetical protein
MDDIPEQDSGDLLFCNKGDSEIIDRAKATGLCAEVATVKLECEYKDCHETTCLFVEGFFLCHDHANKLIDLFVKELSQ